MKKEDWVKVIGTSYKGAIGFVCENGWDTRLIYLVQGPNGKKVRFLRQFDDYNLELIPYSIHPDDLYTLTDIALYKGEKQWFDELRKKEVQP